MTVLQTGQKMKMFSVWYWTPRLFTKWVTVTALSYEQAKAEVEALPDFYKHESITEQ